MAHGDLFIPSKPPHVAQQPSDFDSRSESTLRGRCPDSATAPVRRPRHPNSPLWLIADLNCTLVVRFPSPGSPTISIHLGVHLRVARWRRSPRPQHPVEAGRRAACAFEPTSLPLRLPLTSKSLRRPLRGRRAAWRLRAHVGVHIFLRTPEPQVRKSAGFSPEHQESHQVVEGADPDLFPRRRAWRVSSKRFRDY